MLRWSRPRTLWSTYVIASGTATRSTPSSSNCIPAIVPVASSRRTWSTSSTMSSPGSSRPLRRCASRILRVRVRGAGTAADGMTASVDAEVSRQALRLALGAELTHRAGRIAGGRIAAGGAPAARAGGRSGGAGARGGELRARAVLLERPHRRRSAPPYPGATGGVEELRDARRLVLACTALD